MNKKQAEVEKELLKHEQKAFKELKATYNQALEDIKGRVLNLQNKLNELNLIDTTGYDDRSKEILESMKQSKIYQLEFQKTLEKEINAILDVTKQTNVSNIQSFLTKMYQDSYMGIQYDINSKGIPIVTPINPSLLVEAVNKKTEDMTFAQREVANMNDFKKTVKSEISRGIANASTYSQIAQQLSMKTNEALYKSKRIVRTEGARVSTTAKLTSIRDEIEQGADLVKIWDSTLDGKTRPVHMELDGQIREVDEPFEAGGYEVQGPGMFDDASQDCNCRCVLLTKPRWDLEKTRKKYDNENGDLIETTNYQDWKQGYYRVISEQEYNIAQGQHITNEKNYKNIISNGFNLSNVGSGAGTTFGKGIYFTTGENELTFYKNRLNSDKTVIADIDTTDFMKVEYNDYMEADKMFDTIIEKFTDEQKKEYRKLLKEFKENNKIAEKNDDSDKYIFGILKNEAGKVILEKHYPGLIIKQNTDAIDVVTGGNQIVVYDLDRIKIKKKKIRRK